MKRRITEEDAQIANEHMRRDVKHNLLLEKWELESQGTITTHLFEWMK